MTVGVPADNGWSSAELSKSDSTDGMVHWSSKTGGGFENWRGQKTDYRFSGLSLVIQHHTKYAESEFKLIYLREGNQKKKKPFTLCVSPDCT